MIMYYTDKVSQLLIVSATFLIHVTFGQAVVYLKPYGVFSIIEATMLSIFFFIAGSSVAMSFLHMVRLNVQLD